ncbi:cytochrome P450 [Irpex rosettiformis]|uniref:Cytochrome P450 n=1 Tax=Irpex rosettiformis TaxID=378272 RepID=A0ACB8UDT0_9APHY|nr:cytochrome P450 [Irpex rosettiformis]
MAAIQERLLSLASLFGTYSQAIMMLSSTITLAIILAVLSAVLLTRRHKRLRDLPPGPPGWPILGNLFDLPKEYPWIVYSNWSKTYGDIIFLRTVSTPMLIVSSSDIAFDLMDKRSAIYSSKEASVMDKMTGWEFNLGLMPYGQRWRNIRRKVHEHFNRMVTPKYHDKQTKHIQAFLRRCLTETGRQFNPSLMRQLVATTILDVVYGIEIESMDDDYIKIVVEALEVLGETRKPGKYWADFIPLLQYVPQWVPGASSVKFAAQSRPIVEEMVNKPFDAVRNEKNPNDCTVSALLAKIAPQPDIGRRAEEEVHARHAAGVVYAAASETTFSLLQTFFCGMALNPGLQQRARNELDSVAVFLECIRWMPAAPLGAPHSLSQDDYSNGYFIPSDTIIVPNVWHMLHNPEDYPEPDMFNPDRFMKNGGLNPVVRDPTTIAFGFGRRICPGRHFAKDSAFLVFASMLHVFDIMPSIDEGGGELDPTPELKGSIIAFPTPLNFRGKPRSEAAERLIRTTGM